MTLMLWFLFTLCLAGIAVGVLGAYAQWAILKADWPTPRPVDYTPTGEIVIGNEYGPYVSVCTNKNKTRIGFILHRVPTAGTKPFTHWIDSQVTPQIIDALKKIEKTL
jgi:hypothetical protein